MGGAERQRDGGLASAPHAEPCAQRRHSQGGVLQPRDSGPHNLPGGHAGAGKKTGTGLWLSPGHHDGGSRFRSHPIPPLSLRREGSEAPGEPHAPAPPSHSLRRGYIWHHICIAASRRTWAASEILGGARARGAADNCHTQARRGKESPGRQLFLEEPASDPSGFGPSGKASTLAPGGAATKSGMGMMLLGSAMVLYDQGGSSQAGDDAPQP